MEGYTKVFVYWNLHRGLWSVKALEGEQKGRVIARVRHLSLRDVEFKVSEAGRQRVLRENRKNVHAGAVGYVDMGEDGWINTVHTGVCHRGGTDWGQQVTYNPRKHGSFYMRHVGPGPWTGGVLRGPGVEAQEDCANPAEGIEGRRANGRGNALMRQLLLGAAALLACAAVSDTFAASLSEAVDLWGMPRAVEQRPDGSQRVTWVNQWVQLEKGDGNARGKTFHADATCMRIAEVNAGGEITSLTADGPFCSLKGSR